MPALRESRALFAMSFGELMSDHDLYARTVEAIYASATQAGSVSEALEAASRLLGARGATLEVIDKRLQQPREVWAAGLPAVAQSQYLEQFAALNPRIPPVLRQRPGEVSWDYQLLDEQAMTHDPFYSEFLPSVGLRYFISAVLAHAHDRISVVTAQRSRPQGHVGDREISLMRRLCPHFQRANDMRTRINASADRNRLFENALDLLSDGIALLGRGGKLVYVNEALRLLAAREKDFRIDRNAVEFSTPELRSRFAAALGAAGRVRDPAAAFLPTDFAVPREDGLPPYTISVRPLRARPEAAENPDAMAMLLVHDPLQRHLSSARMLQELYGLTNAEAHLVQALSSGMTAVAYARSRRVSITTVYTHLRRTREKTGWKSVAELTRRFHELSVALRTN
jgi:DNA-binding CsgD family transcriptional regulator/PAS domain-containing protein